MIISDFKYALRTLARARGFALAVVLTLGLGIGATTAIFSVVRAVLLKPLPHRDGDRLVYLRHSIDGPGGANINFSVPEILDFRNSAKSLRGVAEYSGMIYTLQGEQDAVRINVGLVTGNYFQVMGLAPVAGRLLNDGDDGTNVPPVMVLTNEYWMRRFGGDPSIIGKAVRVDGRAVEVVGVVEPAPYFPTRMDALLNMVISEHHTSAMMVHGRSHRMTEMIARLTPGSTVEQARAEVAAIRTRAESENPADYDKASNHRVSVIPFQEVLGERAQITLWLLMGAAAFLMVISAANVANLTLMRGVRREQELNVRAALGSGTARLRRLLLAENLVLAAGGALLGLLIAFGGVRLLISLAERYSPRANEIRLDGSVLAFTLILTVVLAVILSFVPRLAREGSLGSWLATGMGRMTGGVRRQRLQRTLVVAQIAVSVVLLTGAGLLTRTMIQLSEVDTGLTGGEVLTMEVPLTGMLGRNMAETRSLYERMKYEVAAIPGVAEVGVGTTIPLRTAGFQLEVKAEGRPLAAGEPVPRAEYRTASSEYFRAAGIPLLRGREFLSTDRDSTAPVVILNKTLADHLFGDRDPIGQRIGWTGEVLRFIGISDEWRTVVGVVGDTRDAGLDVPPVAIVFQPFSQEASFTGGLVIRARSSAASLIPAATRAVRTVTPQEAIENVMTIDQIRDQGIAPRRLNAALLSSFSVLALVIAAVGIAGVLAFSVNARTNEIGVRMSLGADSGRVQRMVLREGGVLLVIGLAIGVTGAVIGSRLIRSLLFGVAPHDPLTLAGVALTMAAVGLGACWIPALRAAKIDPAIAIRRQ
ncbi:MAG: ABC transporter permease [Gemmatimonadota bacterium]